MVLNVVDQSMFFSSANWEEDVCSVDASKILWDFFEGVFIMYIHASIQYYIFISLYLAWRK